MRKLLLILMLVPSLLMAQEWKQVRMNSLPALEARQMLNQDLQPQGYEIRSVRGDLLGYSEQGDLATDTLSPAMKSWLQYVNAAAEQGVQMAPARKTGKSVKPLLTTQWSQTAPYYNQCPLYDGTNRSATGCVATAMAQIMNYWKWPARGAGSIDYTTSTKKIGISVDFNVNYDWTNMKDRYTNYTAAEAAAVATLMYHCGASCKMNYDESSGAQTEDAAAALKSNFYYSDDIDALSRDYYSYQQWDSIVRAELDAGRPILHSGYTTNLEGHAFVCDGYDSNGYFHFNWGWGGVSDGYFLLTALTPATQGTGGSSNGEGFNYLESIITRIYPDTCSFQPVGGTLLCLNVSASSWGRAATLSAQNIYNSSMKAMNVTYGFALYDLQGNRIKQLNTKSASISAQSYGASYTASKYAFGSDIPNGTYYARFEYKHNNKAGDTDWHAATTGLGAPSQVKLKIGNSSVSVEQLADTAQLSLVSLGPVAPVKRGYKTLFRCKMANRSWTEYNGIVQVLIANLSTGTVTEFDKSVSCFVANDTSTLDYIETLTSKLDTGDYRIGIKIAEQTGGYWRKNYYTLWGDDFHVGAASGFLGNPIVVSATFDDAQLESDGSTMAHVTLAMTSSYFSNYLVPYLVQGTTRKQSVGIQQLLSMEKGDTISFDIPIDNVSQLECGNYTLGLYIPVSSSLMTALKGNSDNLKIGSCETALDEVPVEPNKGTQKILRNGQLLIVLPDGRVYNSLGQKSR